MTNLAEAARRFALHGAPVALALAAAGCASTGDRTQARDFRQITAGELSQLTVNNAYDAVALLRPRWLQSRGRRSDVLPTEIIVAQGSSYLGPVDALRGIPLESVRGMRYMDASQATAFISGLAGRQVEGAIVIDFGAR